MTGSSRLLDLYRVMLLACIALLTACSSTQWTAYRQNVSHTGDQPDSSALSNPAAVPGLHQLWSQNPPGAGAFRASPIVYNGKLYIGNANGRFYALDTSTGNVVWQYPPAASPALLSAFTCNPSSEGIAASATIATVNGTSAVIFGAPDQTIGAHLGSGRLFALDAATGAELWKSDEVASVTGTTWGSDTELHEQMGYSAPVVYDGQIYVGIANHCDNPIQNGKIVAVDLSTGHVNGGFSFAATNTRGGGVWNSPAVLTISGNTGLLFTTGNARCWNGGCQAEPTTNHTLSMLRLDSTTGALVWKFQPVPFAMDDDPDWSAGVTLMSASCGTLAASVMKDGWAYAIDVGTSAPGPPSMRWQFPPTHVPFVMGDGTTHGDTRYLRPGATWGDVFIVTTGGLNVTSPSGLNNSYSRVHALNACAAASDRIRWIKDVPTAAGAYSLGPPSVTRGITYIGTSAGHLIAIADPSIAVPAGFRCGQPDIATASCVGAGFTLVPDPAVLADVTLSGSILTEPVLVGGKVYVATGSGMIYGLGT
jgi:outer membrane protein assembly factor BamB